MVEVNRNKLKTETNYTEANNNIRYIKIEKDSQEKSKNLKVYKSSLKDTKDATRGLQ